MEKQRMKQMFKNLNINNNSNLSSQANNHLNKGIRKSETMFQNKFFRHNRGVCRQLDFDIDPSYSPTTMDSEFMSTNSNTYKKTLPTNKEFAQESTLLCSADKLSDKTIFVPITEYEDNIDLLTTATNCLTLPETNNYENALDSFSTTTYSITEQDLQENFPQLFPAHISPNVIIHETMELSPPSPVRNTNTNALPVQEHEENNPPSSDTITKEKTTSDIGLYEDPMHVSAAITASDLPLVIETENNYLQASTATSSIVSNIPLNAANENNDTPPVCFPSTSTISTSEICQKSSRKTDTKNTYLISPINSGESDPDLSDSDPTYYIGMERVDKQPPPLLLRSRRSKSISSSSSSSSSSSGSLSESVDRSTIPERRSRKRKRDPKTWKFNNAKRLRNTGQAYISVRTNKVVDARSVKPPCNEKCRLKCSQKFAEQDRKILFDKFWSLNNIDIQRAFIKSCMIEVKPKYKYSTAENPRKSNNAFYIMQGDMNQRVCKTFFINTFDITDRMIRTVKEKSDELNFLAEDKRGKHGNHKKVDAALVSDMKSFIDSIPRVESHYTRATSSCEYISPGKTLTEIYQDFVALQEMNKRPSGKFFKFYEIFKDTGIKFHQPKKDLCDLCRDYKLTSSEVLKDEYDKHLEEKELSRIEKRKDRYEIDQNNICAVYDLEAILQAPLGKSSSFYYKTKMNCYNFTIAELAKKNSSEEESNKAYTDVYSYFWDETHGQKGSVEIATCVLNFLKLVNERNTSESVKVTFYSDNCCGQNKNKFIATIYMYALTQFENINCIIHKYLIKGHTQNENDNAHSLIEKEIQKYLKAETIYTPVQYIPLIKSAKKTGKKFQVQTLTFEDFVDVKNLQTQWGLNFTKDTNRNQLTWNDVKILEFRKEDPFKFYFKTSYKEEEYREIDVRAGRRKLLPMVQNIVLGNAYNERFQLNENKKKDLKSLITKKVIPPYYASYYNDVI